MDRPGSRLYQPQALGLAALLLDRFALGANARDHRAHLAHAHPVRDLHLDLIVVDHLGHLADQPAGSNDRVAAAQVLDQLLVVLRALLLRPQDQEIHDDEDQDEGQQLHPEVAAAEWARLGISGRHKHLSVLCGFWSRARVPPPRCSADEIGADYSRRWPNCNVAPAPNAAGSAAPKPAILRP